MRTILKVAVLAITLAGCKNQSAEPAPEPTPEPSSMPPIDANNIVSIASASHDHTTLVAALRAADYVTGVANPGPLTVFAPTNAAFAALPAGTVDNLMRPANVSQLRHVLQHHVVPSVYPTTALTDGQVLGMVDGTNVTVHVRDGHFMINDANIVASIRASNGIVHVIDKVLVPDHM